MAADNPTTAAPSEDHCYLATSDGPVMADPVHASIQTNQASSNVLYKSIIYFMHGQFLGKGVPE